MDYSITPRIPGVRPQDPPDYDGITFVYVFTQVLDPWTQPPPQQNVTIVVANAQGFVPGMTIVIENAGYYQIVSTTALDRMTIMNHGTSYNVPPGTGILPGKITTTSLPGPPGEAGEDGVPGPPGAPLNPKGTVATVGNLPPTGNQVGDLYNVTADHHSYAWDGVRWVDLGLFGATGAPGAPGVPGPDGQPAYTLSIAGFVVPQIGVSVTVAVEDSSWATLREIVWVQDAGGTGIAGPMQVTAIAPGSLTLLNIGTSTGGGTAAAAMIFGETPSGNINGVNTNYVSANLYVANSLSVFLNGLRQRRTGDYNETGNQTFAFLAAPLSGDSLCIDYVKS